MEVNEILLTYLAVSRVSVAGLLSFDFGYCSTDQELIGLFNTGILIVSVKFVVRCRSEELERAQAHNLALDFNSIDHSLKEIVDPKENRQ